MKKFIAFITIIVIIFSFFTITTVAENKPYEYFKSQLNSDEQEIYKAFLKAAVAKDGMADIPQLSSINYEFTSPTVISSKEQTDEFVKNSSEIKAELNKLNEYFKNATSAASMDHPEYYWIINNPIAQFSYSYKADLKTVTLINVKINIPQPVTNSAQVLDVVNEKLQSIGANGDDIQKVKTIHDWLCNNVIYKETENAHDIYGALFEGKAVCQGYAEAFKTACDYYGVKCVCVEGKGINSKGQTEAHMWNYVLINNTWYAVDVTWDDQSPRIFNDFYLVGANTVATNFNNKAFKDSHLSDGRIGGTIEKQFSYPELSQNAYSKFNPTQAPTKAPTPIVTKAPAKTSTPSPTAVAVTPTDVIDNMGETNQTPTVDSTPTPTTQILNSPLIQPTEQINDNTDFGDQNKLNYTLMLACACIGLIVITSFIVIIIRKKR
ncbi:MAG: hypothetical protein E7365_01685 [Clostridiales bacterium]|nr:hypothetical protein [Clostridiales bacterium]